MGVGVAACVKVWTLGHADTISRAHVTWMDEQAMETQNHQVKITFFTADQASNIGCWEEVGRDGGRERERSFYPQIRKFKSQNI